MSKQQTEMKKIMFNDRYGLTKAVLDGRKTMTRRIATELNHPNITDISEWGVDNNGKAMLLITYDTGLKKDVYPHFQIGEEVAVAQAYKNDDILSFNAYDNVGAYHLDGLKRHKEMLSSPGYRNKMFVKAEYMPHRIRITDIKVERLQDISDENCIREGIMEGEFMNTWDTFYFDQWGDVPNHITFKTPREAFASLIDRISGRGTWERNSWVFAYEFELIK